MAPRSSLALILSLLACIYVVNGVWTSPSLSRFEWWLQPSNGTAGEVLDHQPWVSLVRSNPGQPDDGEPYTLVSTGYWAEVYVVLAPNPYATVYSSASSSPGYIPTAEFSQGIVNFTDIYFTTAGWYTLRIVADGIGETVSDPFYISPGPPSELVVSVQPGHALGGQLFAPQPRVTIQDGFGNVVPDSNVPNVTVSLHTPLPVTYTTAGVLDVPTLGGKFLTVPFVNGTATFLDLYINSSAAGYKLLFTIPNHAITPNTVVSNSFTVAIGPTVAMYVLTQPDHAYGGAPFLEQPRVALVDAAGNINVADSYSNITVSIGDNPSNGQLLPQYIRYQLPATTASLTTGSVYVTMSQNYYNLGVLLHDDLVEFGIVNAPVLVDSTTYASTQIRLVLSDGRLRLQNPWAGPTVAGVTVTRIRTALTVQVVNGVAQFSELMIDKIGVDYTLLFTSSLVASGFLYKQTGQLGQGRGYGRTDGRNITVTSWLFNVAIGDPSALVVTRPVVGAISGGEPFAIQPAIAVVDKGGNIITDQGDHHNMTVTLLSNPTGATLFGMTTIPIVKGVASFEDLGINLRGTGYVLEFESSMGIFTTTLTVDVDYSAEYQVTSSDGDARDFFGRCVDIDGDWAIAGAPYAAKPRRAVQAITTSANVTSYGNEIQVVTSSSDHAWEVQRISIPHYSPDSSASIGGYITVSWNGAGPSRAIPVDIFPAYLQVSLEADLAGIGTLVVTYPPQGYCSSNCPAFAWDVTFTALYGVVPLLTVDTSLVTVTGHPGALLTPAVVELVPSTLISGTFTLSIMNYTTAPINFNAAPAEVEAKLAMIGTGPVTVTQIGPDHVNGYTWLVTFTSTYYNYDVPLMIPNYSGLHGVNVTVAAHTSVEGTAPVGGTFQMMFRGEGPSYPIPFNADIYMLGNALESIVTIDSVSVSIPYGSVTPDNGETWYITFWQTRTPTDEGMVVDGSGYAKAFVVDDPAVTELPPLELHYVPYLWRRAWDPDVDGMLSGTGASVFVHDLYGETTLQPWDPAVRGSPGYQTGAAYVYQRNGESWQQVEKLVGSDSADYHRFGDSVTIQTDVSGDVYVAVGAPYAQDYGTLEVQKIVCLADGGDVRFQFGNGVSVAIPYNANANVVQQGLLSTGFLSAVSVDFSLNAYGQLCSGSGGGAVTLVTIVYPEIPNIPSLQFVGNPTESGVYLAQLQAIFETLTLSTAPFQSSVAISLYTQGTRISSGLNATSSAVGAVYTFELVFGSGSFVQGQKLMRGTVPSDRTLGDRFGASVSMSGQVLAIGIPGDDAIAPDSGAVAVFYYSGSTWVQHQIFHWDQSSQEDQFGAVLAMDRATIAVSAPNANGGLGVVYIYRTPQDLPIPTSYFHISQILNSPITQPAITPWTPRLEFGYSVSVDDDTLVIGSPGHVNPNGFHTGAAFVYDRLSLDLDFGFRQALYPSTSLDADRVGQAVAVQSNVIAVTARGNWSGIIDTLHPRFEVQQVAITASVGSVVGQTFRLGWQQRYVPAAKGLKQRGASGLGDRPAYGTLVDIMSDPIPYDCDEPCMRLVLQEQLSTGRVFVNRFGPNQQLGYRWLITFMEQPQGADLPLIVADASGLSGENPTVTVTRVSKASPAVRAFATVYTRDPLQTVGTDTAVWTEQSVIFPVVYQQADLFGSSASLSGNTVLFGAPNRDWFYSGVNAGAALFYHLGYLNVRFSSADYSVSEGGLSVPITVQHCVPVCQVPPAPGVNPGSPMEQPFLFQTLDGDLFPIYTQTGSTPPIASFVRAQAPANGRLDCSIQSYNTSNCEWVNGNGNPYVKSAFDFRGISDYAPLLLYKSFTPDNTTADGMNIRIVITDDTIVEVPDETFFVQLFLPGISPVWGSNMWSSVLIVDDGDGGVADRGYMEKMYAWEDIPALTAPDGLKGGLFGSEVAIGGPSGTILIAGAPGMPVSGLSSVGRVQTYTRVLGVWSPDQWLDLATPTANARFGTSVALDRDTGSVAIVGAPGIGAATFFVRSVNGAGQSSWTLTATIVVSYPNRDPVLSEYGCGLRHSVAISGAVAVMGCSGWESVFVFRDSSGVGTAWAQTLRLSSVDYKSATHLGVLYEFPALFGASVALYDGTLLVGSPQANYAPYNATTYDQIIGMPAAVRRSSTGLVYLFQQNTGSGPSNYSYQVTDSVGGYVWVQQTVLQAVDAAPGMRFGASVAVHKTQVIVGAPGAAAQPNTTWDFEQGTLRGWTSTGKAFQSQPTYGDNTAYRNVYSNQFGPSPPQPSNFAGRYWIGTFENRPANTQDFTLESTTAAGTVQGDGPQGTLVSQPFIIGGSKISFLIGGGCNERLVYVELLIDDTVVQRATGACVETMSRVVWDVSLYRGRSGQIRIVDAASGVWGHINVDDFKFDWPVQVYIESTGAGSAYIWRLKEAGNTEQPCVAPSTMPAYLHPWSYTPLQCVWEFQQELLPNDKRAGNQFGYSVAIDDDVGTAAAGAIEQSITRPDWDQPGSSGNVQIGVFGSMYSMKADAGINSLQVGYDSSVWSGNNNPYLRNIGSSRGSYAGLLLSGWDNSLPGFHYRDTGSGSFAGITSFYSPFLGHPLENRKGQFDIENPFDPRQYRVNRGVTPFGAGVNHTDLVMNGGRTPVPNIGANTAPTGVVYVFSRQEEVRDGLYRLLSPPFWAAKQHTQLSVAASKADFRFGTSVALSAYTLVVGAPGDSLLAPNTGAITLIDTEYKRVQFAQKEYRVSEGVAMRRVVILVNRYGDLSGSLTVQYSTRDITAIGVNATYHQTCLKSIPFGSRSAAGCGDYEQTRGLLYFKPTSYSASFTIYLADDWCPEPEMEYFEVQLSVPGGAALIGEGYSATVRIDDDDLTKSTQYCLPLLPTPSPTPTPDLSIA